MNAEGYASMARCLDFKLTHKSWDSQSGPANRSIFMRCRLSQNGFSTTQQGY